MLDEAAALNEPGRLVGNYTKNLTNYQGTTCYPMTTKEQQ